MDDKTNTLADSLPQIPHAELVRRIESMTAVDAHPHYAAHALLLSRVTIEGECRE